MPGFAGANRGQRSVRYDATHMRKRKAAFAGLPEHSPCCRCGHDMWKHAKDKPDKLGRTRSALHYDHDEHGTYLGFSHGTPCPQCGRRCNVKAGAAKGARVANARRKQHRATRSGQRRTHTDIPQW